MQEFDKISIPELSKKNMFMILHALEYTGKNANINSFVQLKKEILKELSELAETTEENFMKYLEENYIEFSEEGSSL